MVEKIIGLKLRGCSEDRQRRWLWEQMSWFRRAGKLDLKSYTSSACIHRTKELCSVTNLGALCRMRIDSHALLTFIIQWNPSTQATCGLLKLDHIKQVTDLQNCFCVYEYIRRGSVVGWGTTLQTGRPRVLFPTRLLDFSIDPILPAALRLWGRLSL
jgi:hypothetical protein